MEVAERLRTEQDWDSELEVQRQYYRLLDEQGGEFLSECLYTIPPNQWNDLALLLEQDPVEAGWRLSKVFRAYLRRAAEKRI